MYSLFKKSLTIVFLTIFSFSISFAGTHPAAKYNDFIVKRQHKVVQGFMKFYKKFEKGTKEQLHAEREILLKLTTTYIADIQKLDAFEGDDALKKNAIALFTFYKVSLETEYPHMVELIANRNRSKEDHAKLEEYKLKLINTEKEHDDNFENAQIAFAQKHKLTLIHPKM